jgi:hypothetical protein
MIKTLASPAQALMLDYMLCGAPSSTTPQLLPSPTRCMGRGAGTNGQSHFVLRGSEACNSQEEEGVMCLTFGTPECSPTLGTASCWLTLIFFLLLSLCK